ncbi:MAG: TIGR02391 family protein [Acidimicrobiales bacterium]
MLSIAVNTKLSGLISKTHALLGRAQADASSDEVALRVTNIRQILDDLQKITGLDETGAFGSLRRHLRWLQRRHREGRPDLFAPDVEDIRERDLPGVVEAVEAWGQQLLDAGLVAAISTSWEAQHYGSAVRDAFIHLEDVLRDVASLDPDTGLSGAQLVTSLLTPSSSPRLALSDDGFMAHLTSGEREGLYNFVNGAFRLFRNATAHRNLAYTAAEAEDIIHVINLCLRLFRGSTARVTEGSGAVAG